MRLTPTTLSRIALLIACLGAVVLTACKPNPERRELEYMPDMYMNQALKPQEEVPFLKVGSSMLTPPEGTLPRGFIPYPYRVTEGPRAGEELKNPLPRTREVLEIGRKYYNIHCIACHGPVGSGDGLATQAHRELGMPIPPQLYSEKIRNEWKDGEIYHTISLGQARMPSYANRIDPIHRWAIVHYVRALGEAAAPSEDDLKSVEKLGWVAKEMDSPLAKRDSLKLQSVYRLPAGDEEEQ